MLESEIMARDNFDTVGEDPGFAFAFDMGLEFGDFLMEQLEKELSAGEPQLIPDDEMDDALWVCFSQLYSAAQDETDLCYQLAVNEGDELDHEDSKLVRDLEIPTPEAPKISTA